MDTLIYAVLTEQQIHMSLPSELPPIFGNEKDTVFFHAAFFIVNDVTICLENTLQQLTCISHISKMTKMGRVSLPLTIYPELKALINALV